MKKFHRINVQQRNEWPIPPSNISAEPPDYTCLQRTPGTNNNSSYWAGEETTLIRRPPCYKDHFECSPFCFSYIIGFLSLDGEIRLLPPWYKDHLAIKTTLAAAQSWSLYQAWAVYSQREDNKDSLKKLSNPYIFPRFPLVSRVCDSLSFCNCWT